MTGDKVGHMRGIIPRSVEQIVEQAVLMRESGWEIIVTASMVRSRLFLYLRLLFRHHENLKYWKLLQRNSVWLY
jgi:kinesin family member C1